jgi:hypothetical protein
MRYFPTKLICRKSKAIEPAEPVKGSKKSDEAKGAKSKKEKANPTTVSAFRIDFLNSKVLFRNCECIAVINVLQRMCPVSMTNTSRANCARVCGNHARSAGPVKRSSQEVRIGRESKVSRGREVRRPWGR